MDFNEKLLIFIISLVGFYGSLNYFHTSNVCVNATILEMESPPLQTNLSTTNDTQDIDLAINVDDMEEDALFENRTQSLSRGGATDIDIDGFPPEDVTVIITSEKVFVTRSPWNLDLTDEIMEVVKEQIAD